MSCKCFEKACDLVLEKYGKETQLDFAATIRDGQWVMLPYALRFTYLVKRKKTTGHVAAKYCSLCGKAYASKVAPKKRREREAGRR